MDEAVRPVEQAATGMRGGGSAGLLTAPPDFIENLPMAVYACDATGRVRWFNQRAVQLWGRSPQVGEDAERFTGSLKLYGMDGSILRQDETPLAEVLRTGQRVAGREATVERPDGTRLAVMVHIDPLRDGRGTVIGAINCFHDVTDAKVAERKRRESEKQLRELIEALPAAIYTTDAAGRITFYNQAAVELSGRRPVLGRDEWCVTWRLYRTDGSFLPHDECPMAVALKEDRAVRGEEAIAERPDGSRVHFIPYPTPLHDAAGNLTGAVNMLVDISQRKEAESQHRVLLAELNHRVKNNMQVLISLLHAARRETRSAEAYGALTEAIQRVGATAVAHKVLYQANDAIGYSAGELIGGVCATMRQSFGERVAITSEVAPLDLANDTAMPLALILNELLTNAAKYGANDRGEAIIRVGLAEDGGLLTLAVADDGPGFIMEGATRRSSGLGLVLGLVRQIGGTFTVERGRGAICRVRFRDERFPRQ